MLPFDLYLFADNGGAVGAQLQYESLAATLLNTGDTTTFGNDAVYRFDAQMTGLNLVAGTPYWLSIQSSQVADWRWHNGIGPNDHYAVNSNGSGWMVVQDQNRCDEAYVLSSVPEPASMLALGLGLAALLARRRRK